MFKMIIIRLLKAYNYWPERKEDFGIKQAKSVRNNQLTNAYSLEKLHENSR